MAWRDTVLGLTLAESLQLMIDEKALSTKEASEIIAAFDEVRARTRERARSSEEAIGDARAHRLFLSSPGGRSRRLRPRR